jgi:hypothetical protein
MEDFCRVHNIISPADWQALAPAERGVVQKFARALVMTDRLSAYYRFVSDAQKQTVFKAIGVQRRMAQGALEGWDNLKTAKGKSRQWQRRKQFIVCLLSNL